MFGFVSKKKLLEILEFLYKNNDTEKPIGETGEARINSFYFRCGVANACNAIASQLNLPRSWDRRDTK